MAESHNALTLGEVRPCVCSERRGSLVELDTPPVTCPRCSQWMVHLLDRFCSFCGSQLLRYCTNCGGHIELQR